MQKRWSISFIFIIFTVLISFFTFEKKLDSETVNDEQELFIIDEKFDKINDNIQLKTETLETASFTTHIEIPIAGIDKIDKEVSNWIHSKEQEFIKQITNQDSGLTATDTMKLAIHSDVKQINEEIVTYSISVNEYTGDRLHNQDQRTFNINIKSQEIIKLVDVIDLGDDKEKHIQKLLQLIPLDELNEELLQLNSLKDIDWSIETNKLTITIPVNSNSEKEKAIGIELKTIKNQLHSTYKQKLLAKEKEPKKKDKKKKKQDDTKSEKKKDKKGSKKKKQKKKGNNKKLVALTFDDGPSAKITNNILKTLDQYDAKATFFVLSNNVKQNPKITKKIVKNGHEIANHSHRHYNLNKLKKSLYDQEIKDSKKIIKDISGVKPKLFRPPYGEYNKSVLNMTKESDQQLIMWSVDSLDWKYNNVNKVYNNVINYVRPGSIILMHDIHEVTDKVLPKILEYLEDNDYELVTVSELINHIEPATNNVYYGK